VSTIEPGALVVIRTADGQKLRRRATSTVVDGLDFPVVWVATEEDWAANGNGNGDGHNARPWPAEDVALADDS
jgi:hypothetical protein